MTAPTLQHHARRFAPSLLAGLLLVAPLAACGEGGSSEPEASPEPAADSFAEVFVLEPEPEPEPTPEPASTDGDSDEPTSTDAAEPADGEGPEPTPDGQGASPDATPEPEPEDDCKGLSNPDCDKYFLAGLNPTQGDTPEAIVSLHDGDEVPIICGVQGAWMVNMAYKTKGLFEGKVLITAHITAAGEVLVDNGYGNQPLKDFEDGFLYYLNYWAPFDPPPPTGTEGTIAFSMSQAGGNKVEGSFDVIFVAPGDGEQCVASLE